MARSTSGLFVSTKDLMDDNNIIYNENYLEHILN